MQGNLEKWLILQDKLSGRSTKVILTMDVNREELKADLCSLARDEFYPSTKTIRWIDVVDEADGYVDGNVIRSCPGEPPQFHVMDVD